MYTGIIIDDEQKPRDVLEIKVNNNAPQLKIVGKASNVDEAIALIENLKPQIIFLDISMPEKSGFDLLEHYQDNPPFETIFVTGYDTYGVDALKAKAVDYLLKPIKTQDLLDAINKAIEKIDNQQNLQDYRNMVLNFQNLGTQETKIAIPCQDSYEFLCVKEIIRCEGWQKYTKIYTKDGVSIVSSYNIGVYKDMLEPYLFFQTHKSHLVNIKHIKRYLREGEIVMSNGDHVPVSRRKKDDFINDILKKNR